MEKRMEQIKKIYDDFEWLDLKREEHIQRIDERLNQNALVGMTVDRISTGEIYPVQGITLWWAVQSLVPRIIWKGKTVRAGSMDAAGYFTGQEYAKGTSVGLGQVMELYGNYKTWGVVIGMFLLGWLISIWDIKCGQALRQGDWRNYSCFFILLVPLLHAGGSSVELFSGTAAAAVLVWFLKKYVFKEKSVKPERLAGGGRREAAEQAAGYGLPAIGEGRAGGQGSVVSDHPSSITEPPSTESVRHERPKRFVYGEDSKK